MYALSRNLQIPLLVTICAAQQHKCFMKWRSSNCIIRDLIRFIPSMLHYSWTKVSKLLKKKNENKNIKNIKEVKDYWINRALIIGSKKNFLK